MPAFITNPERLAQVRLLLGQVRAADAVMIKARDDQAFAATNRGRLVQHLATIDASKPAAPIDANPDRVAELAANPDLLTSPGWNKDRENELAAFPVALAKWEADRAQVAAAIEKLDGTLADLNSDLEHHQAERKARWEAFASFANEALIDELRCPAGAPSLEIMTLIHALTKAPQPWRPGERRMRAEILIERTSEGSVSPALEFRVFPPSDDAAAAALETFCEWLAAIGQAESAASLAA